jgi:cytochrome bd-type quinol oxidase subunit 2
MALTVILLIYFQGKGYFTKVTDEHIHDLGKLVFAFSIFWAYLWFSQFMLIWYANVGEETIYFYERMNDYPVLFFGNLLLNFIMPFFVLMRNDTKRKRGTLLFASCVVLFGHWIDYFLMLKPGILHTALHGEHAHGAIAGFSMPGLIEVGTFIGFLGLFLYMTFRRLAKMPIEATNDPYLDESAHHHVGYGGGEMHHDAHEHH